MSTDLLDPFPELTPVSRAPGKELSGDHDHTISFLQSVSVLNHLYIRSLRPSTKCK